MSCRHRTDRRSAARVTSTALALVFALIGCDGGTSAGDGGMQAARVTPRFELAADPMDFGAIPFPDDLYLDDTGRIALGALPGEERAMPATFPASVRDQLHLLDGFSPVAPIFFAVEGGALDPSSLPSGPAESTLGSSGVFLVDVDSASPNAFRRVPVIARWDADGHRLVLRPYDGHPLVAGRRYAAVVTTALRDDAGMPIGPSPRFAGIRDAASRPSNPADAEAWDEYASVLASLASNGTPRDEVASLAVFTVQTVIPDLRDARAAIWDVPAPTVRLDEAIPSGADLDALLGVPEMDLPGVDVPGGVAHRHIGWLLQGHLPSSNFLSTTPGVHGRFTRGADGTLEVLATASVPFTLTLPTGDISHVPMVVFQHGVGGDRSDALALADALAAAGWGVLAIDLPFHGMRARGSDLDTAHRFGATTGPDGFGDRSGMDVALEYFATNDDAGELPAGHPVYVRDAIRQSAVDLMSAARAVREGDWSAVRAVDGLYALGFADDPLAFIGVSTGGGAVFLGAEPEVGAAVLDVPGGDFGRMLEASATYSSAILAPLLPKIGLDPSALDAAIPVSFRPELALYQTLVDGGDAMAFAPLFADRALDVLIPMAEDDEVVPNRATEALARAAGAEMVDADPVHTDLARASAPLAANVDVSSGRATRGVYRFAPASHSLLSRRMGTQGFAHPPEPPFTPQDPVPVDNPIDAAVGQVLHFLESWRSGATEIAAPAP